MKWSKSIKETKQELELKKTLKHGKLNGLFFLKQSSLQMNFFLFHNFSLNFSFIRTRMVNEKNNNKGNII